MTADAVASLKNDGCEEFAKNNPVVFVSPDEFDCYVCDKKCITTRTHSVVIDGVKQKVCNDVYNALRGRGVSF